MTLKNRLTSLHAESVFLRQNKSTPFTAAVFCHKGGAIRYYLNRSFILSKNDERFS